MRIWQRAMGPTCFESFIRSGAGRSFTLTHAKPSDFETKQDSPATEDAVRQWVDDAWNASFGATTRAILKTKPFEFSAAGLADLDMEVLRAEAVDVVRDAMARESFDLSTDAGQQRALAVLLGYLNQAQQMAMGIDFYVWSTQHDSRVRADHADRDDEIFRWDTPPEGGHPTQDFGCRCHAQPLGIEGYWARVKESVDAFTEDVGTWEGNIDYMYLDSELHVTVGKGKLLPDGASAAALPFRLRGTDEFATDEEVRAEYELVAGKAADGPHPASYYEQFTNLILRQDDIDRLVTDHVRSDFNALLNLFPGFGNFPLSAQIALWDMIYNLGPNRLRTEFPMMRHAILRGDWAEAARQSHRLRIAEERNNHVRNLFMDADSGD